MDIVVLMKHVPDLVEELEIDEESGHLDRTFLRLVPNEMDEHALEQAILLKERHGGTVTVLTLDGDDVDDTLYTAAAKGADRLVKIAGELADEAPSNLALSEVFDRALADVPFDLLLTGTQAVDDLDASLGSLFAARRDLPYVGYITAVEPDDGAVKLRKEYPGGMVAQLRMQRPGVVGVQAADTPPRYVVTSLVMDAMKSASLEEREFEVAAVEAVPSARLQLSEPTGHAEILEGGASDVAQALIGLMREHGVLAEGGAS